MNRCFFKRIQLVLLFLFLLSAVAGCGGGTDTPDAIAGSDISEGSQTSDPEQSDYESEADVVTKQYYIVGEQQYCLIHLTSYSGSESTESVARSMVDSFIWN